MLHSGEGGSYAARRLRTYDGRKLKSYAPADLGHAGWRAGGDAVSRHVSVGAWKAWHRVGGAPMNSKMRHSRPLRVTLSTTLREKTLLGMA